MKNDRFTSESEKIRTLSKRYELLERELKIQSETAKRDVDQIRSSLENDSLFKYVLDTIEGILDIYSENIEKVHKIAERLNYYAQEQDYEYDNMMKFLDRLK